MTEIEFDTLESGDALRFETRNTVYTFLAIDPSKRHGTLEGRPVCHDGSSLQASIVRYVAIATGSSNTHADAAYFEGGLRQGSRAHFYVKPVVGDGATDDWCAMKTSAIVALCFVAKSPLASGIP